MNVQGMEAQLKKNVDVMEQLFLKHEQYLKKLASAIAKYVEVADIAKPLADAAGAEIESKGRATKRTVYGKAGFGGKKGKGLAQYLSEKTWALGMLMHSIGLERKLASEQARYVYATLRETDLELKQEHEEEKKVPAKTRNKLKQIEKLTVQCEKILKKEANRDKKLEKVTIQEIAALRRAYMMSMKEGAYARGLTRLVFAGSYLKRLMLVFQKEEIFFAKFMKEENFIVDEISKDIKGIFKLIKDHEKIEKVIGKSPKELKGEESKIKKEESISNRIKKLMKSLQKIQKHLEKVKKGAAKYGVEITKSVSMIDAEERELLKEEQEMEKELKDIDTMIESMQRFSTMMSKFVSVISTSEMRLQPQLNWINNAFVTAYKISKKNPSGALPFIEKVGQFAQKSLEPALKYIDSERKELFKELGADDGVMKRLESDMSMMWVLMNNGFLKNLKKLDINLEKIEKAADTGTKKAIKELNTDIKELRQSLKDEKVLVQAEGKAGAQKTAGEESETMAKIHELQERIIELTKKHRDMKHEFTPAVKMISKAIKEAPHFTFAKSGMFHPSLTGHLVKDIESAERYLSEEEHTESAELGHLNSWLSDKSDMDEYVKFVIILRKGFAEESMMLDRLMNYYKDIAELEHDFIMDMRKAERTMMDIEMGIQEMGRVMNQHNELFGDEEKEIITELREMFNESKMIMGELKKTEQAISIFSHNLPQMEHSINEAENHVKEFSKILNISIKNSKVAKKFFGNEVQAQL